MPTFADINYISLLCQTSPEGFIVGAGTQESFKHLGLYLNSAYKEMLL